MNIFAPSDDTLQVCILLLPESSMMTLASVLDVMRAANRFARRKLFSWSLVTTDGKAVTLTCGLAVEPDGAFHAKLQGDVFIVIGGFNQETHINKQHLRQLLGVFSRYKMIGGIEAGSWVLARAGVLDGKKATTHWEDLEDFALKFPRISVRPDRFVVDQRVFTTGGASPSFDFMLHLIRMRYGYHLALEVSSAFIYDGVHTAEDAQPFVSMGILETYEPRVAAAIRIMEASIDETLSIAVIAKQLSLSVRTLENVFQQTLEISPGKYYLRLRLQSARRLVLDTRLSMQEIAVRTGFSSLASFSRQFRQYYKTTASQLRKEKTFLHKSTLKE